MKMINWKEIPKWKGIPSWKGAPSWKGIRRLKGKKALLGAGAGLAAVAIVAGIVLGTRGNGKAVDVYPFTMVGMTEYWGDNQESYGPVTTDKIQTVFLSDTQIITSIPVQVGAHVKKGDVLMTYDTTLSELELERKRLDVEKAKLQVTEAEEELRRINQLSPSGGGGGSEPDYGGQLDESKYKVVTDASYDGTSEEKALVCWIASDIPVNNSVLQALYYQALNNQELMNTLSRTRSSASEIPDTTVPSEDPEPSSAPSEPSEPSEPTTAATEAPTEPTKQPLEEPETSEPETPAPVITSPNVKNGGTFTVDKGMAVDLTFVNKTKQKTEWSVEPAAGELLVYRGEQTCALSGRVSQVGKTEYTLTATVGDKTDTFRFTLEVVEPSGPSKVINDFYVVLKKTVDNREKGATSLWQGVHVYVYNGNEYGFSLFDAPSESEFFGESDDGGISFDFGSGMTSAEIAQLRREQTKKVQDLYEAAQMAESEYKLMEREFNDGNVRSDLDGQVVSVLTEDEARQNKQPIIKVSGGGGFYVTGSVSELEKDNLKIGQSVTVNDWNTGNTYDGQVVSIGDFPTDSGGWNGTGNPNASYYPFQVFIDGSADLQEDSFVSVTYSAAQAQNGVYLENAFLRTDDGEAYVYVRGAHNKLEKRYVTTGKSLWGSYTEIRSGLSAEDYVAFPYGKTVKAGAPTQEGDPSALYGY
ncbi:MAG TPA: hypothetical protein DFH97_02350 [Clostridiales bacterium]|nr:hypothetical protein [Clostridiales bacterium]